MNENEPVAEAVRAPPVEVRSAMSALAETAGSLQGLVLGRAASNGTLRPSQAQALMLQRTIGNRATRRLLARTPRDDQIKAFHAHIAAKEYKEAALQLNGFDKADIRRLATAITHDQRVAVHQAALDVMAGWPTEVPAIIASVDTEAARVGKLFADFEQARKAANWAEAAKLAAAFADGDLHARLAQLSKDELKALRALAGNDRITDAIDVLLDDVQRPLLVKGEQHFDNTRIQALYAGNRLALGPRKLAALHELDKSLSGKWSKLKWEDVAASAAARVLDPTKIDQALLGVCGPAAALQANADANALDYAQLVSSIYATGAVRGSAVNKALLGSSPYQSMDPADWMAMSAIQDVGNAVRDYPGHPTDHDASGKKTGTPWDKHGGYDPEGGFYYNQKTIMEKVDHSVQFAQLECSWWGVKTQTLKVSAFLRSNPKDVVVAVNNDSGLLNPPGPDGVPLGTDPAHGTSDHWVRLLEPVTYKGSDVTFTIFTWGKRVTLTWPEARFNKWVYGYLAGARRYGIVGEAPKPEPGD